MLLHLLVGSVALVQTGDTTRNAPAARPAPVHGPAAAETLDVSIQQAGEPSASRIPILHHLVSRFRPAAAPHPATELASALEARRLSPTRALTNAVANAPVMPPSELAPMLVDSLVVEKRSRTLTAFFMGRPVRAYRVALGRNPVGDKVQRGDDRTPEGVFRIDWRNPRSQYFLALHISYPEPRHRDRAARLGVDPGGDILIHGLPPRFANYGKAHLQWDWTNGCVAVTNEEMEELWRAVPDGTPVQIKP